MRKEIIYAYLKIIGALLMISPLLFSFFALDFGITLKTFLITGSIITLCSLLGIGMFRYLEGPEYKNYIRRT